MRSTRSSITPRSRRGTSPLVGAACSGVLLTLLLPGGCGSQRADKSVRFDTATIRVDEHQIQVEVADTPARRERGLMFRDSLSADAGMLFIYPDEDYRAFWMKNTRIPLSIAFAKSDGWVSDILDMEPASLDRRASGMRVKFALEMNRGWFKRHGVRVGSRIEIPTELVEGAQ